MTKLFIIITFAVVVCYDIFALVTKRRTITSWLREWYKHLPVIPWGVAVVLIGHVTLYINFSFLNEYLSLIIFIIINALVITWNVINKMGTESKLFKFFSKHWYITMALGSVVGCLWWM